MALLVPMDRSWLSPEAPSTSPTVWRLWLLSECIKRLNMLCLFSS